MAPTNALTFDNLTLGYQTHAAVHHLSGTIECGSMTAIVGANGSGKSTLLKGIAGILKPLSGTLKIKEGLTLAFLPQRAQLDLSFPATVLDLVSLGLWPKRGLLARFTKADMQTISQALHTVGLEGFEQRPLNTLSGGQLQRTLFARVIVQNADLILLDEPFNALDAKTTSDLTKLIHQWHEQGRTLLMVAHDLELIKQNFPRTIMLARTLLAWGKTPEVLTRENLRMAQNFNESWDENAPWCDNV